MNMSSRKSFLKNQLIRIVVVKLQGRSSLENRIEINLYILVLYTECMSFLHRSRRGLGEFDPKTFLLKGQPKYLFFINPTTCLILPRPASNG